MEVNQNKVVSLTYELRRDNAEGEIVETVTKERPLTYLTGAGNLLAKFESNLEGLKVGESFNFKLDVEDAYGQPSEKAVVNVPMQAFEVEGKIDKNLLKIGNIIPMIDSNSRRIQGVVKKLEKEHVVMDFNHPLAGEALFFSGEITAIREATEEELQHGHVHDSHSCDNCDGDDCQGHHHH
ncbi:MAG: FKBP-type peptidyl-prolyl cis-trans isomerase [Bacteroidota bacterium]